MSNNKTNNFIKRVNKKLSDICVDDMAINYKYDNGKIFILFKSGMELERKRVSAVLFSNSKYLEYFGWFDAFSKTINDIKMYNYISKLKEYMIENNITDEFNYHERVNDITYIVFKSGIKYKKVTIDRILKNKYFIEFGWFEMFDQKTNDIKCEIKNKIIKNNCSRAALELHRKLKNGEIAIDHSNRVAWNKGKKTNIIPWNKGLTKDKCIHAYNSSIRMKNENPFFKMNAEERLELHRKQHDAYRHKIKMGYTPKNNRLSRKDVIYNDMQFRSSWEVCCHLLYNTYEYEKLRIDYKYLNKNHIYIVDFISFDYKHVIEVKPIKMFDDEKILAKENALIKWCNINGYRYSRFTEKDIIENYDRILELCKDESILKRIEKVKKYEID